VVEHIGGLQVQPASNLSRKTNGEGIGDVVEGIEGEAV
jgi:hypothetical protein